jgi:hypothetical protein
VGIYVSVKITANDFSCFKQHWRNVRSKFRIWQFPSAATVSIGNPYTQSRDSSVSIVTGYGLDSR